MAKARSTPCVGININDKSQRFTAQILSGQKTIETRQTRSLDPYIGKRVGLIRTGTGKATLVGYATVGEPIKYSSEREFDADYRRHRVAPDSPFYIDDVKYGYPLIDVEPTRARPIESRGIVSRKINPPKARSAVCGGRTVRYGAKGAKVMPGTPKGDAYCARSLGQMRDYPAAAADPCSPLRLSRKRWACKGGTSMKRNPATESDTNSYIIAPEPGPWANVIIEPDWTEPKSGRVKRNPVNAEGEEESAVPRELLWPVTNAVQDFIEKRDRPEIQAPIAARIASEIDGVLVRLATFQEGGASWIKYLKSLRDWIRGGMIIKTIPYTGGQMSAKAYDDFNSDVGRSSSGKGWPIFMMGNSKLPYMAFSTLPGTTCPGAGACLFGDQAAPSDGTRILAEKTEEKKGGWCYSFKAWRYPATFRRHVGNTMLLATVEGREHIANVFTTWARTKGSEPGMNIIRLYVDGDIHDRSTLDFWLGLCDANPQIQAYGYSKSWGIFRRRNDDFIARKAPDWPANYTVNLSSGAKMFKDEIARKQMESLPISREVFAALTIAKDSDGEKLKQNIATYEGAMAAIKRLDASIAGGEKEVRIRRVDSIKASIIRATTRNDSVLTLDRLRSSLRRAEKQLMPMTAKRKNQLVKLRARWLKAANEIKAKDNFEEITKSFTKDKNFAKMGDAEQLAYTDELSQLILKYKESFTPDYIATANAVLKREKMFSDKKRTKPLSIYGKTDVFTRSCFIAPSEYPEEFWLRNPKYTAAMKVAADAVYGKGGYFACPGKCGNCLGNGLHACGERGLKKPIVIGIH